MATWTIKGESGKRLNDTERTFQALGIQAPRLKFVRQEDDEFSFSLPIMTTAGAGIDGVNRIPEAGQVVEVFRNGVRKFKGNAMFPELTMSVATVRVVGPHYWNRKIRVANWLPECATMDALLKSVEYDLDGNRVTYVLGAPPVVDYRSLIGRTMSQRIDRTVML